VVKEAESPDMVRVFSNLSGLGPDDLVLYFISSSPLLGGGWRGPSVSMNQRS
jgi:hypothetical protein